MSIRKTSEYRDAMKAHKACYSDVMDGPKLTIRMVTIAKYHTSLEKLVSRMLKDEGIQIHYINSERDTINGQTYYDIDFGAARSFIAGLASGCGAKIPIFHLKGNFELSVDMTPDDVLCEVRMCLQERDNEFELAKAVITSHVAFMKEHEVE